MADSSPTYEQLLQRVQEQDALEPKRNKWVADFLERIQTRGTHIHYDQMRKVRPEEIPTKPKRKFRVVF